MRRHDYCIIPTLNELPAVVDEHSNCLTRDLTIGREGYGSVSFPGVTNLAGVNLDEIGELCVMSQSVFSPCSSTWMKYNMVVVGLTLPFIGRCELSRQTGVTG